MSHLILQEEPSPLLGDSTEILVPLDNRPRKQSARITVVEQVYFQPEEGSPTLDESRYARKIDSDEQPYSRTTHADDRWNKLDHGWVEDASMVAVYNLQWHETSTIPTQEARDELAKKVLEVMLGENEGAVMLVGPGESMRFQPKDLNQVSIRSAHSRVKFKVVVYPR